MTKRVIVVGAGMGGLTCTVALAENGSQETGLESHTYPGVALRGLHVAKQLEQAAVRPAVNSFTDPNTRGATHRTFPFLEVKP